MRGLMERFVLLPFSAGCISESSIPVVMQHPEVTTIVVSDRVQHLFMLTSIYPHHIPCIVYVILYFYQFLSVYKDVEMETEMGLEIGFPTDVKHMTHTGLDGCTSSIFPTGWNNNLDEPELINLHYFPFKQLELANSSKAVTPEKAEMKSILQTRCDSHDTAIAQ